MYKNSQNISIISQKKLKETAVRESHTTFCYSISDLYAEKISARFDLNWGQI
jgi:hypothetical protein